LPCILYVVSPVLPVGQIYENRCLHPTGIRARTRVQVVRQVCCRRGTPILPGTMEVVCPGDGSHCQNKAERCQRCHPLSPSFCFPDLSSAARESPPQARRFNWGSNSIVSTSAASCFLRAERGMHPAGRSAAQRSPRSLMNADAGADLEPQTA